MSADYAFRSLGYGGNGVDIERRGVARENRTGLDDAIEFGEDFFLHIHLLEYRFDHHIDIVQVIV